MCKQYHLLQSIFTPSHNLHEPIDSMSSSSSCSTYQPPWLPLILVNSLRLCSIFHRVPNPCLMTLTAVHIRTTPILFDIVRAVLSRALLRHTLDSILRGQDRYCSRVAIIIGITAVAVMPGDPVIEARATPAFFARDHGVIIGPVNLTVITRETSPIARVSLALLTVCKLLEPR